MTPSPSDPTEPDRTHTVEDPSRGADPLQRAMARLAAGVLAEGGRADKKALRSVQATVETGGFDPDAAASRLLPGLLDTRQEDWLEERSKSLMRDLVMAPKLRGLAGVGRSARRAGRNLVAYVLTQVFVLGLFTLLFAAGIGLLRYQGIDVQGWVDRGLQTLGLEPGAGKDDGILPGTGEG